MLHAGIEHGCNFKQLLHSVAVSLVHAFRIDLDTALAEHYDLRLLHKLNAVLIVSERVRQVALRVIALEQPTQNICNQLEIGRPKIVH